MRGLVGRLEGLERFFRIRFPRFAALKPATTGLTVAVLSLVAAALPWLIHQDAAAPIDPKSLTLGWFAASAGLLLWWCSSQERARADVPAGVRVGLVWSFPVTAAMVAMLLAPAFFAEASASARLRALVPRDQALGAYNAIYPYDDADAVEIDSAAIDATYGNRSKGIAYLVRRDALVRTCDIVLHDRPDKAAVLAVVAPDRHAALDEACRTFFAEVVFGHDVDVFRLGYEYLSPSAVATAETSHLNPAARAYVATRRLVIPAERAVRLYAVAHGRLEGRVLHDRTGQLLLLVLLLGASALVSLAGIIATRVAFACLAIQTIAPVACILVASFQFQATEERAPSVLVTIGMPVALALITTWLVVYRVAAPRRSRLRDVLFTVAWFAPLTVIVSELAANPTFFAVRSSTAIGALYGGVTGHACLAMTLVAYSALSIVGGASLTRMRRAPRAT